MRGTSSLLLLAMLSAACGDDAEAPLRPATAPTAAAAAMPIAPRPATGDAMEQAAARALNGDDDAAVSRLLQSPAKAARAVLQAAATADVLAKGRAPQLLAQLGDAAIGELAIALHDASPARRRIAALACLYLGADARPLANALLAARDDADAAVRTAAELAWRAAIADQSELYRLQTEQDAMLQQLQTR